ncbi:MAG: hypothetical protein JXQ75_02985 [Phycisphaerae bacterium]|nr:hypothetical protein [Phycisphaerae bacterium]
MPEREIACAWIAAIALSVGVVGFCSADMVVLAGGKVHVGLIKSDEAGVVLLATGDESGSDTLEIPRSEIIGSCRGIEEAERIRECKDPASLERWAAGYFHTGLEDFAGQCLLRALELDASIGVEPRKKGAESFRLFWNRTVFRRRAAGLSTQDAPGLLEAARWAREAGLVEDARYYLRLASHADWESTEIPALAADWGLGLESWIRLDLTPVLESPLLTEVIQDEGIPVAPRPDMVFLTLPLRYDWGEDMKPLTKNSLRGRDMRGFYGMRVLRTQGDRPRLVQSELTTEPLFERLEFKVDRDAAGAGRKSPRRSEDGLSAQQPKTPQKKPLADAVGAGPFEILAKNTQGARRFEGEAVVRDPPKVRTWSLSPTGWLAVVVEIPKSAKRITYEWPDGREEEVDLDFLRRVRDPLSELAQRPEDLEADPATLPEVDPAALPPAISAFRAKLTERSAAMASLAVARFARFNDEIGVQAAPAWLSKLDDAVIVAGARREQDVRSAAWSYFASRPSVPEEALAFLGRQDARVQREWIALIESVVTEGERITERTHDEPSTHDQPLSDVNMTVATELLGGILRSNDRSVCDATLDALMRLKAHVDWGLAEHASETSRSLALSRLESLTDEVSARRLLRAVMKDVRPVTAADIAIHARRLDLRVVSPDDVLLTQWSSMVSPAERVGLLTVLEAVSLGDVVYSERFATIVEEATADGADASVREAAFRVLVEQAWRRVMPTIGPGQRASGDGSEGSGPRIALRGLRNSGLAPDGSGGQAGDGSDAQGSPSSSSSARGHFPVLVSVNARDPLINGLARAAKVGERRTRIEALAALLLMGYAEIAADSLVEGAANEEERDALLEGLVGLDDAVVRSDGLPAMLGRLLRRDHLSIADFILSHLRTAAVDAGLAAGLSRRDRWRLFAAVKAGVDFGELSRLKADLRPLRWGTLRSLLHNLCHMTGQDRERFDALVTGSGDVRQCVRRLELINSRRGYRVDGQYGALAILETVVSEGWPTRPAEETPAHWDSEAHYRWSAPQRVTVVLHPLRLKTGDGGDVNGGLREGNEPYQVRWREQVIGRGTVERSKRIQRPSSFSPRLENAEEGMLGRNGWGWPDPIDSGSGHAAVGPVVMRDRAVSLGPAPGKMVLDTNLREYLLEALRKQQTFGDEDLEGLVPEPYVITLRYAAFGSFYGVGHRRPLPTEHASDAGYQSPRVGQRHLLNVMLVLERIDSEPISQLPVARASGP